MTSQELPAPAEYRVDFVNETDRAWTLVIAQRLRGASDVVAWKTATADAGSSATIRWQAVFCVVLADYLERRGRASYHPRIAQPALPASTWDVVNDEGVQRLRCTPRTTTRDTIIVRNVSHRAANVGVGMDCVPASYKRNLLAAGAVVFHVETPQFDIGLFNQVSQGDVIASAVTAGPCHLDLSEAVTHAVVTARLIDNRIDLDIRYP